jgi:hypothetical protein
MEPLRKDVQELVCLFFLDGHAGQMLYEEIPDRLMPALGAGLDQGFFIPSDRAVNVFCATNKAVGESGCCDSPPADSPPVRQEEPLTDPQKKILQALDGKALGVEALAAECDVDTPTLYKQGLKTVLETQGRVKHKHGLGWYRTDRPPK